MLTIHVVFLRDVDILTYTCVSTNVECYMFNEKYVRDHYKIFYYISLYHFLKQLKKSSSTMIVFISTPTSLTLSNEVKNDLENKVHLVSYYKATEPLKWAFNDHYKPPFLSDIIKQLQTSLDTSLKSNDWNVLTHYFNQLSVPQQYPYLLWNWKMIGFPYYQSTSTTSFSPTTSYSTNQDYYFCPSNLTMIEFKNVYYDVKHSIYSPINPYGVWLFVLIDSKSKQVKGTIGYKYKGSFFKEREADIVHFSMNDNSGMTWTFMMTFLEFNNYKRIYFKSHSQESKLFAFNHNMQEIGPNYFEKIL